MSITQYSNFMVETAEVPNMIGESVKRTQLIFKSILDEQIIKTLRDLLDSDDSTYLDPVKLNPDTLYPHLKTIESKIENGQDYSLIELASWLNDYHKEKIEQLSRMEMDGKINFDNLESIITIGTSCISMVMDEPVGFIVLRIDRGVDQFGNRIFSATGKLTASYGDKFAQFDKTFIINEFRGAKDPSTLLVRPISDEEKTMLTERGRKLIKYGKSGTFVGYSGTMFRKTSYGIYRFNVGDSENKGRVMVDPVGFEKKIPGYSKTYGITNCENVPEDLMFMCYPFVNGFSFDTKQWGEMYVGKIEDIEFDDNAFDYLVLDTPIKNMVKALVTHSNGTFSDIIHQKSGGTIICLAGNPGIGKSLTAQSIAELKHQPLYCIGAGELGSTVEKLEIKLAEILEIARAWNAIILIDEADIFMEKRTCNDLMRNAMVSVFLRLLETYQGIMFLTTNRHDDFDPAFKSRISISIKYKDLDQESRAQVWTNLLKASGVDLTNKDIHELAIHELNGRQIKNAIRMGQCIAKDQSCVVRVDIINQVIPFII